jgi:hypothetical protein
MTVLAVGLMVVMLFGVGIVHFSHNTPILKLRPVLEQEYGAPGFETRFRPGPNPWIEVHVPQPVLADRGLQEVALVDPEAAWVEVSYRMVQQRERAEQAMPLMLELAREKGVKDATLEIVGAGEKGVRLRVRGVLRSPRVVKRSDDITRALAVELGKLSWVGVATVTLKTPEGVLTHASGPAVPRRPAAPPSPSPSRPAASPTPAPSR